MSDFYKILGVSRTASEQEIKRAYRKKAVLTHPDKRPDKSDKMFKEVNEAYSVLSDPDKRQIYNTYGKKGLSQMPTNATSGMGSMFGNVFTHGFRGGHTGFTSSGKGTGRQVHEVLVTLEEAMSGTTKTIQTNMVQVCHTCNGHGTISEVHTRGNMMQHVQRSCTQCNGSGSIKTQQKKTVHVNIPKGCPNLYCIQHGQQLFQVKYRQHVSFSVFKQTLDLRYVLEVTLLESLIGINRVIEHPSGECLRIRSKIPLSSGMYSISHKGIHFPTENIRGHLYIDLMVRMPESLVVTPTVKTILPMYLGQEVPSPNVQTGTYQEVEITHSKLEHTNIETILHRNVKSTTQHNKRHQHGNNVNECPTS